LALHLDKAQLLHQSVVVESRPSQACEPNSLLTALDLECSQTPSGYPRRPTAEKKKIKQFNTALCLQRQLSSNTLSFSNYPSFPKVTSGYQIRTFGNNWTKSCTG